MASPTVGANATALDVTGGPYFFTNASDDIRRLFTDALDRLGVEWKRSNKRVISAARNEAVARLDEFVGPKY